MDLLEYQAKTLFAENGIPILPSQPIASLSDIRNLRIPYPVMLKSQVRTRGRGRAGGVRLATNTIDAVAAAQSIFRLPIRGLYPEMLLAETHYKVQRELYLAVILDHNARRPLLLGAATGGMDADLSPEQVVHILVEEEFSPFYVRRLALGMGLSGPLMRSVASVAERMYQLFIQRDLDLVEINPLGVGADGTVMALDGKVRINDNALERHPMLLQSLNSRGPEMILPTLEQSQLAAVDDRRRWCPMDGTVSVVCNGMGLTLATVDWVTHAGGQAAGFTDVGWPTEGEGEEALGDRVLSALDPAIAVSDQPTVLINLVGPAINGLQIMQQLIDDMRRRGLWSAAFAPVSTGFESSTDSLPLGALSPVAQPVDGGIRDGGTSQRTGSTESTFAPPSSPLNLRTVECQRQWPKLIVHCSNLDMEACQALVEPYPIWLEPTIEAAVQVAVEMSTAATVQ